MRITRKFLEAKVAYLNQYLGQSTEAWTKQADGEEDGTNKNRNA
jgi:hypothetical protein